MNSRIDNSINDHILDSPLPAGVLNVNRYELSISMKLVFIWNCNRSSGKAFSGVCVNEISSSGRSNTTYLFQIRMVSSSRRDYQGHGYKNLVAYNFRNIFIHYWLCRNWKPRKSEQFYCVLFMYHQSIHRTR
jgi:hypothetical protein